MTLLFLIAISIFYNIIPNYLIVPLQFLILLNKLDIIAEHSSSNILPINSGLWLYGKLNRFIIDPHEPDLGSLAP